MWNRLPGPTKKARETGQDIQLSRNASRYDWFRLRHRIDIMKKPGQTTISSHHSLSTMGCPSLAPTLYSTRNQGRDRGVALPSCLPRRSRTDLVRPAPFQRGSPRLGALGRGVVQPADRAVEGLRGIGRSAATGASLGISTSPVSGVNANVAWKSPLPWRIAPA